MGEMVFDGTAIKFHTHSECVCLGGENQKTSHLEASSCRCESLKVEPLHPHLPVSQERVCVCD